MLIDATADSPSLTEVENSPAASTPYMYIGTELLVFTFAAGGCKEMNFYSIYSYICRYTVGWRRNHAAVVSLAYFLKYVSSVDL